MFKWNLNVLLDEIVREKWQFVFCGMKKKYWCHNHPVVQTKITVLVYHMFGWRKWFYSWEDTAVFCELQLKCKSVFIYLHMNLFLNMCSSDRCLCCKVLFYINCFLLKMLDHHARFRIFAMAEFWPIFIKSCLTVSLIN